jgi:hypothetical protein
MDRPTRATMTRITSVVRARSVDRGGETDREEIDDNCCGLAAQLAFYFLLGLCRRFCSGSPCGATHSLTTPWMTCSGRSGAMSC